MATARTPTPSSPDGATIIGESVHIRGQLNGGEDLHVLGRVEGRVDLERTLVVAQSGIVKAEVSVKNAIISGVVVGNIHATESVELTREGRMVGDIYSPRIIIVDGASFRGNVDMGDIANMPARKPSAERPRPAPAARPAPPPQARPTLTAKPGAKPAAPAPAAKAPEKAPDKAPEKAPEKAEQPRPASVTPLEPPAAKGLPQKAQKTRVIVKRK
ncbi:MAG: polymer-forming cytoskeletal protein [Deltaproteobacteria bacterium]|nr:polymer-forming cytoskeletal protein [Deltaproteobacteria bacterium]